MPYSSQGTEKLQDTIPVKNHTPRAKKTSDEQLGLFVSKRVLGKLLDCDL